MTVFTKESTYKLKLLNYIYDSDDIFLFLNDDSRIKGRFRGRKNLVEYLHSHLNFIKVYINIILIHIQKYILDYCL